MQLISVYFNFSVNGKKKILVASEFVWPRPTPT